MLRLPRVRFTVRKLMVIILGLAVVFHLAFTAWKVHWNGTGHTHTALYEQYGFPGRYSVSVRLPFWPAYWRRLVGLPLSWNWTCEPVSWGKTSLLLQKCELAHAEIRKRLGPNEVVTIQTEDQIELEIEMMKRQGWSARRNKEGQVWYIAPSNWYQ